MDIQSNIYNPRDFSAIGPAGCNMCGEIISESLVQCSPPRASTCPLRQYRGASTLSGTLRMVSREQRVGVVLWDLFTGSAPYREIIMRAIHPGFLGGLLWNVLAANLPLNWAKSS